MTENNSDSLNILIKIQSCKEKIFSIGKTHHKAIAGLLSLIILATIYLAILSWHNNKQAIKFSTILHQSFIDEQNGNIEKSFQTLEKLYKSNSTVGVKEVASLKYANKLIIDGKEDEAVEVYLNINQNKKFNPFIREYSGLIALKNLVDKNKVENKEKILALQAKLEKEATIFKYHFMEQKAIFLWSNGNFKEAESIFQNISNNLEASEMLKKRAQEMSKIYNSKFSEERKVKAE